MSNFKIDLFELGFLAEACIPPKPIARTMFWQHLTDQYYHQMANYERAYLFNWLNRNECYKQSLQEQEDTQLFHARFDPDNQYEVEVELGKRSVHDAFLFKGRYHTGRNTSIVEDYIINIKKKNEGKI